MLVMLLTLVLRILSGARLDVRVFAGLALQASLALAWLVAGSVSPGFGSLALACLMGAVVVGLGQKGSPLFTAVVLLSYTLTLWWAEAGEGDIPLFMDWFDTLVTVSGAAILRIYLEESVKEGKPSLGVALGCLATTLAVVLSWIPRWSIYSTPLLLASFVGLGALLTKNARMRK